MSIEIFDPVLIDMVRRCNPDLLALELTYPNIKDTHPFMWAIAKYGN